jgi:hypothetical protein
MSQSKLKSMTQEFLFEHKNFSFFKKNSTLLWFYCYVTNNPQTPSDYEQQ